MTTSKKKLSNPYKGITIILYNHLNLPYKITFSTGNTIEWVYDANGKKLRKLVKQGATTILTQDYSSGIEYKNGVLEAMYHAEGRVKMVNNTPKYEYVLRDHLGTGRVYFSDSNADGIGSMADIIQDNHYYPFGLNIEDPRRAVPAAGSASAYQYNNKEFNEDWGLNWSDYGARFYDAAVGRWWTVDPMAEKYRRWSPYNYGVDNPIRFIDPDGMQIIIGYIDNNNKQQTYIYGSDASIPSNTFVEQVVNTLNELVETEADVNGIIPILKSDDSYNIINEIGWDEHAGNANGGSINWSPAGGIVTDEGGRRSPALGLLHELGHGYYAKYDPICEIEDSPDRKDYKSDSEWVIALDKYEKENNERAGKYGNLDDKWVIENVEAPGAKVLGQAERTSHHYKTKYKAESPFSLEGPEKK